MFWKPVPIAIASAFAVTAPIMAPMAAGSLEIGPVRVQMLGKERTSTINVRNISESPTGVQVRAVDWNQPGGEDVYAPSTSLVASPPLMQLAPGESQTIRLVVREAPNAGGETAFRLILDEVPNPAAPNGAGVQTAVRALVPVFVTPSGKSRPKLRWTAVRSAQGIRLTAFNDGDTYDRLLDMSVSAAGQPVNGAVEGYVLSRGSRSWLLPATPAATSLKVSGEGEFGAVTADVPVTQ